MGPFVYLVLECQSILCLYSRAMVTRNARMVNWDKTRYILPLVGMLLLFVLQACEKNIQVSLHKVSDELVVDGSIENGLPPRIVLTHSVPYFTQVDSTLSSGLYIHGARITVSTGSLDVPLREYEIDSTSGTTYFYYSIDTALSSPKLVGRRGGTYKLDIEWKGTTYSATTTIPSGGFLVDSVWWVPGISESMPDSSKAFLYARIQDPPQRGNYARYFTRRNREPFYPGLASVADDEVTNGTTFNFLLDRGVDKNQKLDLTHYGYFNPGDTVTLKFCNIDQACYNFWNTWEYAWSNNGSPFSSPTEVQGNVPGALGYWGGYEAQYVTLYIPKQ